MGSAGPACEALYPQLAASLCLGLSLCTVAVSPNPQLPAPETPPGPSHPWSRRPQSQAAGKGLVASVFGSQPGLPLLFLPSVQGGMDRILNVLTAEEEVRVERDGEGKVCTGQRDRGARGQRPRARRLRLRVLRPGQEGRREVKGATPTKTEKGRNGAIREERGDGAQRAGHARCWGGQAPGARSDAPVGKLRCWAQRPEAWVRWQESGGRCTMGTGTGAL